MSTSITKEKINHKYGLADPMFISEYSPEVSPFGYKGYGTLPNFVYGHTEIQALGTTNLNSQIRFQPPRAQDFLGPLWIKSVWSPVTVTSLNAGAQASLVNFAGVRFIDRLEIRYSNNLLMSIDWRAIHMLFRMNYFPFKQTSLSKLTGGDLSTAERVTNGAAAQTFYTPIPAFWVHHPSLYENTEALSHELDLVLYTPSAQQMLWCNRTGPVGGPYVQTTATVSLTSCTLWVLNFHVEKEEREHEVERHLQGQGVVKAIRDFEYSFDNTLAVGSDTYNIKLTQIRGLVYNLRFVVRKSSSVSSPGTYSYDPFKFEEIKDWQVTAAGLQVWPRTTHLENIHIYNAMLLTSEAGELLYGYCPGIDPEDIINATGHDNFSGFTATNCEIRFPAALNVENYVADFIAFTYNTIQTNKGDEVKNFI